MDLFEIQHNVGSMLSKHDLTCCVRVCQLWRITFIPLLYIEFLTTVHHTRWLSFRPHLHHVRSLQVSHYTLEEPLKCESLLQHCWQLNQLCISGNDPNEFLLKIAMANPGLRQLCLKQYYRPVETILETVARSCPLLNHLQLKGFRMGTEDILSPILFGGLATRLTRLELSDCWPETRLYNDGSRNRSPTSELWQKLIEQQNKPVTNRYKNNNNGTVEKNWLPVFPELREVILRYGGTVLTAGSLLQLFTYAPNLESISWFPVEYETSALKAEDFAQALCEVFQQQTLSCPWPRLDSITIGSQKPWNCVSEQSLVQLLRLCPNPLRKLVLGSPYLGMADPRSQEDVIGLLGWQALEERHLESLEVLRLTTTMSWITQEVLSSCPRLIEFRGSHLRIEDVEEDFQSRESQISIEARLERERKEVEVIALRSALRPRPSVWHKLRLFLKKKPPPALLPAPRASVQTTPALSATVPFSFPWPGLRRPGSRPSQLLSSLPFRPWVCRRLRILTFQFERVPGRNWEEDPVANRRVWGRLCELRELEVLSLCSYQVDQHYGLDPRMFLGIENEPHSYRNPILCSTTTQIRQIPQGVGLAILEIWSGLRECQFVKSRSWQ